MKRYTIPKAELDLFTAIDILTTSLVENDGISARTSFNSFDVIDPDLSDF